MLRDYIAEHERVTNFGGEAVRAIDRGDLGHARHLLGEMATELASHWQGEETGLFRVMAARTPRHRTPSTSKSYARQHNRKAGARPACGRRRAGDRAGNAAVAEPSTSRLCSGQARRLRACINHRPRGTRLHSFRRSTRDDRCLMTPAQSSVSAPSSERN